MIILNKDEVWWYLAPLPPLEHECKTQTAAITETKIVNRCACGAIRYFPGPWQYINSRRGQPAKPSLWRRILKKMREY